MLPLSTIFQSFAFSFAEVAPTFDEVLDFIQSTELEEEHPAVSFVKDVLGDLDQFTGIKGGYIIKEIGCLELINGRLKIDNEVLKMGRQICGYLKESTHLGLFLCTAGEEFTQRTNALNDNGDYLEGYIMDAIGSLTVEKAMDKIQHSLNERMHLNNLTISNRYSPGYCNWPLTDQSTLFRLIGNHSTEITINDSCLMTPRKSVSGVIGIGKNIKHHKYGCEICTNSSCIYRRIIHQS